MAVLIADSPDSAADGKAARLPSFLRALVVDSAQGPRLRLLGAIAAVVFAGVALLLAFPPYDQWWLAPIGIALFFGACHRRRIRGGLGLGFLFGMTFFAPLLSWTSTQVGQVPWLALSVLEALYFALLGGVAASLSRWCDAHRRWWPIVIACLWTAQEAVRDRTPFGGFPWGRLAFSQADSPFAYFAWLGGAPLVTFVVSCGGGLLLLAVWRRWRSPARSALRRGGALLGAAIVLGVAGLAIPIDLTKPSGDAATVAVIQGSVPRLGLEFNQQRRAVLDRHVKATLDLAADVAAGREHQPDVVVWPENASDIDPVSNGDAADQIDGAARAIKAPIVLGTLRTDSTGTRNMSLVWDPKTGPGFHYTKQHPVPFAEYIPMKPVVRTVAGLLDKRMVDGIDRVNGFVPGNKPGVIPADDVTLSGIICFEVTYDDLVRESVKGGAQILAVQTNNATFNDAEARQQLAAVQLRSIEHGRAGLMASTVGVSGFTDTSGAVHEATSFDTQEVIVSTMRLGEASTPATVIGEAPELVACLGAVAVLAIAIVIRFRDRRRDVVGGRPPRSD